MDDTHKITMTDSAVEEVKRLLSQTDFNPALAGVRVGVKGGGCAGFTYTLNFDESSATGDRIFEFDAVRLFCDPKAMLYLDGITLEYTTGLQGNGFEFINPNATGTCGCGDSFSV